MVRYLPDKKTKFRLPLQLLRGVHESLARPARVILSGANTDQIRLTMELDLDIAAQSWTQNWTRTPQ